MSDLMHVRRFLGEPEEIYHIVINDIPLCCSDEMTSFIAYLEDGHQAEGFVWCEYTESQLKNARHDVSRLQKMFAQKKVALVVGRCNGKENDNSQR
jgi:hypothetical protein